MPVDLEPDGSFTTPAGRHIPAVALTWRYSRAGGPGGQHVNTSDTRVELVCDVAECGFEEWMTELVARRLGPQVRVVAAASRSQLQNRRAAASRLADMLDAAAVPPKLRRPTRPSKRAREARVTDKKRAGERKASRSWRPDDRS